MALEIAMDELAEKLRLDPVELRVQNDTQVDPEHPERPFSMRQFVECLRLGAEKFGWSKRNAAPQACATVVGWSEWAWRPRSRPTRSMKSAARVRIDSAGDVVIETDMTDIGTGSYTIIAQTAAEMLGVAVSRVTVRLGDSSFPVSCGSGGQWGGNSSTSGVFAACTKLRDAIARKVGMDPATTVFADGASRGRAQRSARRGGRSRRHGRRGHHRIRRLDKNSAVHVRRALRRGGVDAMTAETRVRRMLAVCAAGRILNPKTARSQVIGAMTMGVGAALTEELVIDPRRGFFVNHDLAGYEVPVHADIPHLDVVFLDETDPVSSPMKAKGVGELGICGAAAAVANAIYNATGVRVRDYPITLDKVLAGMPPVA